MAIPPRARLSRPDDARAIRSRGALRAALLRLIEQRRFEAISIRDITREAGVSYPVFFRRYAAKEDVLADIAADEVRRLIDITYPALAGEGPRASLEKLCDHIQRHRALWQPLLTTGAAGKLRDEFVRATAEIGETSPRANPWLPVSLASRYVASGMFEILAWWLQQPEDYPAANIVAFLEQLIVKPTLDRRDVHLA